MSEKVKLDDVCMKASSNIAQKDLKEKNGIYPIYGAGGYIKNIDFYRQESEYIAIVKDGAGIGKTFHLPGKSSVIGTMQYIIPHSNINAKYLYYAIKSMNLARYYTGSTIPHIYFKDYKNEEIILVSRNEQNKIANILDAVSYILLLRKKQIDELDNLTKSRFVEMFGDLAVNEKKWGSHKLIDLCEAKDDIKCGPFGTQLSKNEYEKKGIPLWGIPQVNYSFSTMPPDYLNEEKAKMLEAYSIIPGDIVMSRKGNIGKCAIYPNDFTIGIMHSDILRIRVDRNKISPEFLMHQLHNSRYVVSQIENVSSGAIMAGVNVTKLKNIFVHVPLMKLQIQFADFVQLVDKQKFEVQKAIDETEELLNSLMQRYFG